MSDLASKSQAELMRIERDIARRHIGKFPWLAVTWALTNLAVWLSLWPLVLMGVIPLWVGFIVATLNVMLSYLPSHEAQHDIIALPGARLRWLNELVGHLSTIPLVLPYRVAKLTHLEHHKHANDPALDPDHGTSARGPLHAIWKSILNRQPGNKNAYGDTLVRIGRSDVALDFIAYELIFYGTLFTLAWTGFALEAALLWWLPRHIALTYIQYYLSWAPHHPATEQGRYRNTRSFRSILGNIGSMGMQYHVIHHLHPRIPLYRTPQAYWEMKPVLEARGARVDEL
ncbi:fatty acid desaturase [Henriciella algicola]|uniref:Beta-carotene hydroxylase n=1 Tax=Henriciella algicola TaxID=1608422 RepID=A0A399RG12_9PROT|nr:fatty acid desaturase [Henriciella algicola]RIJ29513.1 beta-carotene hydroxylase [Henriciella algicola]